MNEETKLVNFNAPKKLLEEFDIAIKDRYNDRTDALLDAMRKLMRDLKDAAQT